MCREHSPFPSTYSSFCRHFKANEAVRALKAEEDTLASEITGARRSGKNLSDKVRELDAQAQAQQEHVYAAEFRIQQMERKVRRWPRSPDTPTRMTRHRP